MSQDFIAYLSSLKSTETQWSIYVNPDNLDEHTCVQYDSPNGWVKAGTPDSLSFGFQNTYDAVESFLKLHCDGSFKFNDRTVRFNLKGLLEAYSDRNGNEELFEWLEEQAEEIKDEWAQEAASNFVECTLPTIIEMAQAESQQYAEFSL